MTKILFILLCVVSVPIRILMTCIGFFFFLADWILPDTIGIKKGVCFDFIKIIWSFRKL